MRKKRRAVLAVLLCIALTVSFYGCNGTNSPPQSAASEALAEETAPPATGASSEKSTPPQESAAGEWSPNSPMVSVFDEASALTEGDVSLDVSSVSKGYAAVKAQNENRLKFQVVLGERKYNYDLAGDGTVLIVPLQSGSGLYHFRVLENISDNKYAEVFARETEVALEDEYRPFLCSSSMVYYTENSQSTLKAQELAAGISNDADFVAAVFDYLKSAVAYDYAFAESNPEMYYPNPDSCLASGKGICFDYAATAAAMMRSVGIPAKLITGYVTPGDIYHAWNMIYLRDKGWITVQISVNGNTWQLIDITFAATGETSGLEYKDKDIY